MRGKIELTQHVGWTYKVYRRGVNRSTKNERYSVIVVSSIPMLIIYPFVQRFFVKGVMIGAIKG